MANTAEVLQVKTSNDNIKTGLTDKYREEMAVTLSDILVSSYNLLIKTHVYHWNVVGPLFRSLHLLTEEQYQTIFEATDIIAERIRALGHTAPAEMGNAAKFAPTAPSVKNATAKAMVEDLIADHEATVRAMREAGKTADENGDLVTSDMLTDRLTFHEKALWMLRAIIAE